MLKRINEYYPADIVSQRIFLIQCIIEYTIAVLVYVRHTWWLMTQRRRSFSCKKYRKYKGGLQKIIFKIKVYLLLIVLLID